MSSTKRRSPSSKPRSDALARFHPPVRSWFTRALGTPTTAQALGWDPIARGESTLLLAPTGSGKTLAAFLVALDRLMFAAAPPPAPQKRAKRTQSAKAAPSPSVRVLYVSPLKALAVDVEKNLRAPLAGIAAEVHAAGETPRLPEVGIRTGDTPARDRARMARRPPEILITTPESLYLILTSQAARILAGVETVIIDEIHAVAGTKRGAHLFLTLERLDALRRETDPRAAPLQRIGLSATQRPLEAIAELLGGYEKKKPRPVAIVDASEKKALTVRVMAPRPDEEDGAVFPADGEREPGAKRSSIWPRVHEELLELLRGHRSR